MKIVAVSTLRGFWERYPDSEQSLKAWYDEAKHAIWTAPHEKIARAERVRQAARIVTGRVSSPRSVLL